MDARLFLDSMMEIDFNAKKAMQNELILLMNDLLSKPTLDGGDA